MKNLVALSTILLLSACSIFKGNDDEIVFDTVLGPETEEHIKTLPANLPGDSENARYTATPKKGEGMESENGTDEE